MTRTTSARSGLAAAFAAIGTFFALDASATGAGPNPGLPSRVEALEKQNARQQARIHQLSRRPNLAGKSCPDGLALVGFEPDGTLKCAAPWTTTQPPPDPQTTFRCVENHDATAAAAALTDYLDAELVSSLRRVPLRLVGSAQVGGLSFDYGANGRTWTLEGQFSVAAPLVEIAAQEPCADAVRVTIHLPDFLVSGEAEFDFGLLGSYSQDIGIAGNGVVLEVLVRLRAPDIAGLPVGASVDRDAETVSLTMVSGDIELELEGGLGEILEPALEFFADVYINQVRGDILGAIEDEVGMQLLSTLSAPVTVKVVAVP
jgi:hypothetical protein